LAELRTVHVVGSFTAFTFHLAQESHATAGIGLGGGIEAVARLNTIGVFLAFSRETATADGHEDKQKNHGGSEAFHGFFLSQLGKSSNPTAKMPTTIGHGMGFIMPIPLFVILLLLASGGVMKRWFAQKPHVSMLQEGLEHSQSVPTRLAAWQMWLHGAQPNINEVTGADLRLLPGIGRALATRILERRRQLGGFSDWRQVDAVRGVGPKMLAKLKQKFVLKI
tara:strand:- start:1055 stop:1723 length:669 start_codon:yes stop_codon:yes gene_type:complete